MVRLVQLLGLAAAAAASLSQLETNGRSAWGTLPSPTLPKFLLDGPMENGVPWGHANPAGDAPNTGVTRHYDFTITRAFKSPDGYNKSVILINDQFPGPMIEANWGDMIQVTVTNEIDSDEEGVTLHWHGILQKKTPWYDGVPGVSQCPIAPRGGKFTYTFQADQFGTGWYHSHYSAQYDDGLYGPMVIYGPVQDEVSYDYDLGPVMISDYFHISYYKVLELSFSKPPVGVAVDNNLINGKGVCDCSNINADVNNEQASCQAGAGRAKFQFHSGKNHRLRLINSGSLANQKFSIDNHELLVVANDYVPVQPYKTNVVTLGAGQRTDVIVHATGSPADAVWMRSEFDMVCLVANATVPNALAAIYYENADTSVDPTTEGTEWESNNCRNDPLNQTVPYYPLQPPSQPDTTQTVTISVGLNDTGFAVMFMDGSSFRADYNDPILLDAKEGNFTFPAERNVYNFGSNSSVRLIFNNTYATVHPMHLHGHNFWVLAEGLGTWDGKITNPENPLRRDTYNLQPGSTTLPSYLVLEWRQDNPGIWPLHCHMSIHSSAGMFMLVMEQPNSIERDMQIPMVMAQTCRDWDRFSNNDFVDQIDSGV
ncbi:multicopper oxidase-domain-containing protein [Penicillium lagena]|uniref:multicopper oxidase-domain-containing protein n=1 Tax=Penicillium lagena TaxID=94218 RepID=UPI00253FD688|nr:multicopper oxidase-domain-containing protein [Penicillium lagena]KAJ5612304.1 multicopper oxidase-domain-containing protein [Penicillium lagena]